MCVYVYVRESLCVWSSNEHVFVRKWNRQTIGNILWYVYGTTYAYTHTGRIHLTWPTKKWRRAVFCTHNVPQTKNISYSLVGGFCVLHVCLCLWCESKARGFPVTFVLRFSHNTRTITHTHTMIHLIGIVKYADIQRRCMRWYESLRCRIRAVHKRRTLSLSLLLARTSTLFSVNIGWRWFDSLGLCVWVMASFNFVSTISISVCLLCSCRFLPLYFVHKQHQLGLRTMRACAPSAIRFEVLSLSLSLSRSFKRLLAALSTRFGLFRPSFFQWNTRKMVLFGSLLFRNFPFESTNTPTKNRNKIVSNQFALKTIAINRIEKFPWIFWGIFQISITYD